MGLGSLVAQAVDLARTATESLGVMCGQISHRQCTGQNALGERTFADPVLRDARISIGELLRPSIDGQMVRVLACVVLLPAAAGEEPPAVSPYDEITLPNGFTGRIVEISSASIDPETGKAVLRVVWLGAKSSR